ncbi:MAG: Hsp20/alpha crystallin family protein [Burkholderiaceae bacterium]
MTVRKPAYSMWADAVNMLERADRLHRQFFRLEQGPTHGPTWEPPADVFETDRQLSVLVALPGVAPDQVKVVIEGGALLVVGHRPLPSLATAHIRRIEIPYGRFERRIELPPGSFEIRESTLVNGCLLLSLLKLA